jgi:urease subunit gamma
MESARPEGSTGAAAGATLSAAPARRLDGRGLGRYVIGVVHLTPADQDKLLLSMAGLIARERRARGVSLNYPESVALLSCWVIERARDGATVEELMHDGRSVLTRPELMEGVPEMLDEVQVEATFPDGRKLVTIHRPVP